MSEVTGALGLFCAPCTVTNMVSIDTTVDSGKLAFKWTNASGGTLLAGTFPRGQAGGASRSNVYTTYASLYLQSGNLRVEETDLGNLIDFAEGAASYFEQGTPVLDAIDAALDTIGSIAEVRSELKGSPTKVELVSRVERTGPAEYAYTRTVNNFTDHALQLEWLAAGLAGTLAPQGSLSSATFLGGAPSERAALAAVTLTETLDGEDFTGDYILRANVLAPVPLPASVWLLAAACALLGLGRARRA
jgi:hypothetical protein